MTIPNENDESRSFELPGHQEIVSSLFFHVSSVTYPLGLGKLFYKLTYVVGQNDTSEGVSITPDLLYLTGSRLTLYRNEVPDWAAKPLMLVPDLVVEIVSPDDTYTYISEKLDQYLADRVKYIWLIDQKREIVVVYEPDKVPNRLHSDDKLTGGDVIPGFEVTVRTLFE